MNLERKTAVFESASMTPNEPVNVRLITPVSVQTAKSAIECPQNPYQTFFGHGLGNPKYAMSFCFDDRFTVSF